MRNGFWHSYVAIALLALLNATALQAQPNSVFVNGEDREEEYAYNANGALTMDLNRGITDIEYDNLGNPKRITFTDNRSIEYVYSADGAKLCTIHKMPGLTALTHYGGSVVLTWRRDTTDYIGNLIVKNGHPEMLRFEGGYASFGNDTIDGLHYYIQDYRGNNRMVVNKDGTIEQITHYYPYGGVIGDISTNESRQKYKFEGKELDRTFCLDNYDIQARQYYAMAPMWDRIDPLATKSPGISPYAFCNGDPVNHIDKDGKWAETLWDVANVVMDVKSAYGNFSNGNTRAGLVDVGATVLDCIAVIAPGIPGGADTAVKAARATDKAVNAVKSIDKGVDTAKAIDKGAKAIKEDIFISPENKIDRELLNAPTKPGNASTFKSDNTSVEIHHVGQNPKGPFIEMHKNQHRGKGSYMENHPNHNKPSLIDRKSYNKQKREYWKREVFPK